MSPCSKCFTLACCCTIWKKPVWTGYSPNLGCCFQGLQQPTQKNSKSFWMEIETRGSLLFQVYHCQRFQFLRLGMSAVNKQEATISAKLHKNPGISNFYFHTLLQPKSKRKFTDAKSWDTPGARGVVLGLAVSLNRWGNSGPDGSLVTSSSAGTSCDWDSSTEMCKATLSFAKRKGNEQHLNSKVQNPAVPSWSDEDGNIFKPEWVDRDRERGHTSSKEIESRDIVLADREL